jgi:predicted ATPase
MRLYVEMGIPDLALRQFHVCEDNLRQLLDIAPRPETIAVYEELMTVGQLGGRGDEPISEPVAPPVLSAPSAPATTSPFVGREPILNRLLSLLTTGEVEGARMVFVSGEAGVGKTRLLEELASRARTIGAAVLWGGVGAHAQRFGYGAFAVALEAYAAGCSDAERVDLSRRYPALGRIAPSLMEAAPAPADDARRLGNDLDLIQAIVRLITDLSRERPVLIVLGDLHDADEFTVDLMRYVAHLARHRPWLIVATVREDDIDESQIQQLVSSTLRERLAQWIELECLSRADCDRLVRHMLGNAIDDDRLQTIYETSRGNPVYIEALVRELSAEGADTLAREGDARTSSDPVWRQNRAAATMQLGMMSGTLRRVLELASLSPSPSIAWEDLRGAAAALTPRITEDVLSDVLDQALRTHILEESEGGYVFRYPMVRAALRDSLPRHRRAQLLDALGPALGDPAHSQE